MSGRQNIYVQCNPLLDITAEVDADFLKQHNLGPNEEHLYYPRFKGVFEELEADGTATRTPGGAGLNTARVAQWLLLGNNNNINSSNSNNNGNDPHVSYVGCIADDEYGAVLRAAAEEDGVEMLLEVTDEHPTGRCAVCKCGDTRSLVADLGAAHDLSATHVGSAPVQAALRGAAVVYTNAYATTFHAKQTLALAAATRPGGGDDPHTSPNKEREDSAATVFAFGLSSRNIMEVFGEDLVDVLGRLDCVIGNAEEMRDLAVMLQWVPEDGTTDAQLVAKLATEMLYDGHTVRRVVMTRGADSVLYATSAGEAGEVPTGQTLPGSRKHIRTGAGDALVGGFLAAFVAGHRQDTRRCVEAGVKAATYAINHTIKALDKNNVPQL